MPRPVLILLLSLLVSAAPTETLWRDVHPVALADDDDGDDDGGGPGGGGPGGGGPGAGGPGGGGPGGGDRDGDDGDRGDRNDDRDDDDGADDGGDRSGGDREDDDDDDDDDGAWRDDDDERDDDGDGDEDDDDDDRRSVFDQFLDDFGALFGRDGDDGPRFAQREIVGLSLSQADLNALETRGFLSVSQRQLSALGEVLHRIRIPAALSESEGLAQARGLAPGAEFDFNHFYRGGGQACDGPACWPLQAVAFTGMGPNACARGAPVAILDTDVDASHPALGGAQIERRSFLPDGLAAAPAEHGTAVAALLVGRVTAGAEPLAPGAGLLAAEVFAMRGDEQIADAEAILAALDWAISRRARVIGMSFAGPENRLVALGVRAAARRANLLAAAGNDGPSAAPAYPAAHPEVAAVAAVDARRRAWRGGNRGDYVELAAPGVGVVSARAGGGFAEWTGTSFAVPFAVAATLRARAETGGDPDATRRLLALKARDLGAPGRDALFGYGLVDLAGGRCF